MFKEELLKLHSLETASHELGHAFVTLALCSAHSNIIMQMTEGHSEEGFEHSGNKYVHGFNISSNFSASRLDIGAIGYAGVLAHMLYFEIDIGKTDDDLFQIVDTLPASQISAEDRNLISNVYGDHKQKAFGMALKILRQYRDDLKEYTEHFADLFIEARRESETYLFNSVNFSKSSHN